MAQYWQGQKKVSKKKKKKKPEFCRAVLTLLPIHGIREIKPFCLFAVHRKWRHFMAALDANDGGQLRDKRRVERVMKAARCGVL